MGGRSNIQKNIFPKSPKISQNPLTLHCDMAIMSKCA